MKTNLYFLVLLSAMLFSVRGFSQATYSQNFENYDYDWDTDYFYDDDEAPCNGTYSYVTNLYAFLPQAQAISPALGTSNGGLVTFTFNYKLLDYNPDGAPFEPTSNAGDWGSIGIFYATSATGPFTLVQTITPSNHIESATCAPKSITFNPPAGVPVYIGIQATLGSDMSNDFYVILDDFQVSQAAPLACTGTPAAATATASTGIACNTTTVNLGFTPSNNFTGLTYQWQRSSDGVAYTNVPTGGTSATYATTQTATYWYRVNITCTASAATTSSAPVRIINTGTNCYCNNLTFTSGVEPITLVNFAGINNQSTANTSATPYIQDFTSLSPGNVTSGQSYPIVVKGNTAGSSYINYFKVYIDFNQNGVLSDPGEGFELGSIQGSTGLDALQVSGNISIPASALTGTTLMRVVKLYWYEDDEEPLPQYLNSPCAGEEHSQYGQAEDYLITISPCLTAAPTATATQTYCNGATVNNLSATGTVIKWYAAATGGTALAANTPLVNGTVYHASQTVGCESPTRTAVTVTLTTVPLDTPVNVNSCEPYTLPALTNGEYRTETNGAGTVVTAGTVINTTTTLYVYNMSGTCSANHTFVVTIGDITADALEDVTACGSYTLLELTNSTYHTAPNGGGSTLAAGSTVNETTTLYIYATAGNCSDENEFTITIFNAVADDPADVTVCESYILPELQNQGIYTTEANGQGDLIQPGDEITETTTIYIYAEAGDGTTICTAENSFVVTVTPVEADELDDVDVDCTGYTLPQLSAGNSYYTGPDGTGTQLNAGDIITQNQTVYIYAAGNAAAQCFDETSFEVTILTVENPGDITVEILISSEMPIGYAIYEANLGEDIEGEIAFYQSEADALNGVNMLPENTEVFETTTYYATITVGDCVSEPFAVTFDVTMGRDAFDTAAFKYHPNPVSDILNISYSENIKGINVFDITGKKVMEISVNQDNMQVDFSGLASGVYTMKVETLNASKTVKIVKNK